MFELMYREYQNAEAVGYKGSYSVAGQCIGFLTLDDQFVSLASCYGVQLDT